MNEEEKAALLDLRRTIVRWRSMIYSLNGASQTEIDAVHDALEEEMGFVLYSRLHKFNWWML